VPTAMNRSITACIGAIAGQLQHYGVDGQLRRTSLHGGPYSRGGAWPPLTNYSRLDVWVVRCSYPSSSVAILVHSRRAHHSLGGPRL
jgi:hypothetical protein